jgi:hypothetical protein
MRVKLYYRKITVGAHWLNIIEIWAKICLVVPMTSQKDTKDDSVILAYLTPCENTLLSNSVVGIPQSSFGYC